MAGADLLGVTAVILAGGKGTRIAGLFPGIPKPMIPVAGQPFLHWVVRWLDQRGIGDIMVSIGHLAGAIEQWAAGKPHGINLRTVAETQPLGTGGAVVSCLDACRDWVLVLNGDSLVEVDLAAMAGRVMRDGLDGGVVGVRVDDSSRYGSLAVGPNSLLTGFAEKRAGAGLINAGVYLFRADLLRRFTPGQSLSMETDIMPALLAGGARLAVAESHGPFLDIGTPESVVLAEDFVTRLFGQI
ncbi:Putative Nucleotidyltransferase(Nucleotidyl transferase,11-234) [Magnetospirillum sp. XM-1]|uniref:sugar phosphate nucleotidyltransferase n=1 Tax=Magnetospirillum sp. XM-1 TaxID=1663591 RepID=UPI00073E0AE6|nr:sugar phosphate nucleotidyltransferase [Magnetospirillum sp. XM-1]CUW38870.1 Putative Nucleotidyltransferase(Nucleotidyl transferase,11-234) [Magnetospirillum sp. XM-1]